MIRGYGKEKQGPGEEEAVVKEEWAGTFQCFHFKFSIPEANVQK